MAGGDRRRLTARRGKLVAIWRPRDWTGGVEWFGRLARVRSIALETPPPPAFAQRSARATGLRKSFPSPPGHNALFEPSKTPTLASATASSTPTPGTRHVTAVEVWAWVCMRVRVSILLPLTPTHYLRSTSTTAKC